MNTGWPVAVYRLAAVAVNPGYQDGCQSALLESFWLEQTPATGLAGAGDEPLLSVRLDELRRSAPCQRHRREPPGRHQSGESPPAATSPRAGQIGVVRSGSGLALLHQVGGLAALPGGSLGVLALDALSFLPFTARRISSAGSMGRAGCSGGSRRSFASPEQ